MTNVTLKNIVAAPAMTGSAAFAEGEVKTDAQTTIPPVSEQSEAPKPLIKKQRGSCD